jgi:hypothetical protein
MSAHTPAPWAVRPLPGYYVVESQAWINDFDRYSDDCDGQTIHVYGKQAEADARLIAAAPDLLAALRELCNFAGPIPADVWDRTRAAIAKAVQS